jgi:hypothetical protein
VPTVLNVIGDVSCAAFVARSEGFELKSQWRLRVLAVSFLKPPRRREEFSKPRESEAPDIFLGFLRILA